MISILASLFCISFAIGISGSLLLVRRKEMMASFFRLHAIIASLLYLAGWVLAKNKGLALDAFAPTLGLLIGYACTVLWLPPATERAILAAIFLLGSKGLWSLLAASGQSSHSIYAELSTFLMGGIVMGASLVAMNVGHSYLNSVRLSMRPLKVTTLAIAVALACRLIWLLGMLVWMREDVWTLYKNPDILLAAVCLGRVLFGLVGPMVLVYLTWETIKIKSTQSATGILYPILILAILGEICAMYLTLATPLAV